MKEFKVNHKHFGIFKNQMLEERKNQKFSAAYQRTSYESFYLLSETLWHADEYIDVIDSITMRELEDFVPDLLSKMYIEVFAHGNFSVGETQELGKELEKAFSSPSQKLDPIVEERTLDIPPSTILTRQMQIEDVNSAVQVYYQAGPHNVDQGVMLDMIQQMIEMPFYHQLRTLEQLGYIVWSGYSQMNNVDGFNFIVQSNTKGPVYLQQRIEKFIMDFAQTIKNISEEEFNQYRQILISKRLEKPNNLGEETSRYWGVIESRNYDFQYQDAEVEALKKLKLKELVVIYDRLFNSAEHKKALVVQAVGKNHEREKPKGQLIENHKDFKKNMSFYKNTAGDIKTRIIRN
ncbi:insulinase family protein, partial [bacterium]|nr:insulinase family protein [bacterium]